MRKGLFDVLVGVNLLREGLDLPEVSLVAIMDADKEGFLRSERSLVQTVGRAARNVNGLVIMYADRITESMRKTIDETQRRRLKQIEYNFKNNLVPTQIVKNKNSMLAQSIQADSALKKVRGKPYAQPASAAGIAADPVVQYMTTVDLEQQIKKTKKSMEIAAREMNFMEAARLRDEMYALQKLLEEKKKTS